jgi:hypothetical protein
MFSQYDISASHYTDPQSGKKAREEKKEGRKRGTGTLFRNEKACLSLFFAPLFQSDG